MFGRAFYQKKEHLLHKATILILLVLVMSACRPARTTPRPPNLNEIKSFVSSRAIIPIVDKLLGDSSVLLYEEGTSYGCYTLTVREPEGMVVTNHISATKSGEPLLILEHLSADKFFVAVVVQEAALMTRTAAIELAIDSQNRLTSTTDGKAGVILVSPSPVKDWSAVVLYDAQGKILYRQENRRLQQLRITNSGGEDIHDLVVLFPGATADAVAIHVEFGDVRAGETTGYRDVPSGVYRYAAYEYMVDSRVVNQAVVDWVGESPMQGERFTYSIQLNTTKVPGNQVELVQVSVDQP